jgi:hypothetical protein
MFLRFLVCVFSLSSLATTFIPISIERQIKDSDAVIQGVYKTSFYKKLPNGMIVTQNEFSIEYSEGIKQSEMRNFKNFTVLSPGGTWQGETTKVQGAPRFKKEEQVVLFLKKSEQGYWIQNLSLGKYEVKKMGTKEIIVSSVFPYHPKMGQMKKDKFYNLVKQVKGKSMQPFTINYEKTRKNNVEEEYSYVPSKSRLPANLQNKGNLELSNKEVAQRKPSSTPKDNLSIWWLIMLLSFMGGATSIMVKRRKL